MFNSDMKQFAYIILSIVVVSVVASSPALAAGEKKAEATKTAAAAADTKIDKAGAEKLVMQKYPGATVIGCEMGTVKDNSVWVVRFKRTGNNVAEKVSVDPQTGKISRM